MTKMFFDVFPTLEVNGDMKKLLSETEVTRVGMNHEKDHIRIYLNGTRLIHKKNIYQLEKNIHDQIFKNRHMDVKVIEKYQLSEQYTAEKLMDLYKDSILEELKNYSLMEYNLLRSAKMEFTGDSHLLLTLENTIIAQTRSHEIVEFLEKVVCERCGLDLSVELAFEEPKESKHKKNSDLQIQFEIKNILKRVQLHEESAPAKAEEVQTADTSMKTATKEQNHSKESAAGNNAGNANGKGENSFGKKEFRKKYDGGSYGGYKKSDNPDVLYGKDFEDETIPIEKIVGEMGEVTIRCQVMTLETREIRNEKTIVIMSVTDFTDSIVLKIFTRNDQLPELLEGVKKGAFLKIKGVTTIDKFDSELTIGSIVGIKKIPDFTSVRMDTSPEKRVELHCHTKMSDMDGVSEVKDIVKRAMKWGHKAIAITDHGDVQAFPDANHAISPDDDFKVIYGVEAYLVDDLKDIITNSKNQNLDDTYVVFDLETTGFSPDKNKIIEIGAVKVEHGEITDRFSTFVNPEVPIPYRIEELTSIRDDMVIDAPKIETILPQFMEFCGDAIMVAHNADFDMSFIIKNCERQGIEKEFTIIDTVALARILLPQLNRFKLDTVAKALGVSLENHHRAVDDAGCTAEIFVKFVKMLHDRGMETLDQVNQMGQASPETIMKMNTYHAIILATNDIGRINLYRLISLSHLTYYNKRPRIPKSEFVKYREGLLLGSACEAGELYRAIVGGRPEEEIIRLVKFYDYLEIQPLGNNEFMLKSDKESVSTIEELQDINRRIVKLGETFGKLVVATCDVHFLDPEDEIYRRIIMAGKGFKDADDQAPLYLRTTEEMLKEFEYLGSAKAEEVVITNPNKIADMCEKIAPVRPDKCPPVIENSDQMLRDICYTKAHSMYGEELPAIVKERLDRELNSIISNGYAVMYIIAQKLVWKSNEDGYLVGSRGSVGSSFAATMSGITEVNPLQAHYRCPNCKYSDFDSPEVKAFSGRSGCDMPDKICPVCGEKLVKDGFDIPFETFLGFKGNKEPDIDLNFSGEYQSKAHAYCEVIFGYGQTFRAGTIGTLADKTAFGYIKNYYEERGIHKRNCEIDRIVQGCVGVRRTTGQHPGGIVVLPVGEEINTFTPVQHPANDMTTKTITTHFDYHSISGRMLKLDILGHDDPKVIRMLQDITGIDPLKIPFDDKKTLSLFSSTEALGLTPQQLGAVIGNKGITVGALGLPEYGTPFVRGMLEDTRPKNFSELVRISGFSHGTDVWLNNAQDLIRSGTVKLEEAISTRDDVMNYLIEHGVRPLTAFKVMENVRKGKGLEKGGFNNKAELDAAHVPQWFIDSCLKIGYLFPRAHAVAYVMMAFRIAWFKVYQPLAYYAAYFTIRAEGSFNAPVILKGLESQKAELARIAALEHSTAVEKGNATVIEVAAEMYLRGMEFLPIDLDRSDASEFKMVDGKLLPPFNCIPALGDAVAKEIVRARGEHLFTSKEDLKKRGKVSQSIIDTMDSMGILKNMPDEEQISLFSF